MGACKEFCLMGYNAMYSVESEQTFRRDMSSPSSRLKVNQVRNQKKQAAESCVKDNPWDNSVGFGFITEDTGGCCLPSLFVL
jgi:hypothetical protein